MAKTTCIALPTEEEQPIGTWGQRHLDYLKQHRRVTYINLLTSGRLNTYLADIDFKKIPYLYEIFKNISYSFPIIKRKDSTDYGNDFENNKPL